MILFCLELCNDFAHCDNFEHLTFASHVQEFDFCFFF